jgi:ribose 5-phosphate isomerase B
VKTVWIGCDHGGYGLKILFVAELERRGLETRDVGAYSTDIVRYPYYAAQVARAVACGEAERGILICSTGIGMSIIANRYAGVRASVCATGYLARMTRAHNDSNILCMGGKTTGEAEALDILDQWLTTKFEGGRHNISLSMIAEAEQSMCFGEPWITDDPRVEEHPR